MIILMVLTLLALLMSAAALFLVLGLYALEAREGQEVDRNLDALEPRVAGWRYQDETPPWRNVRKAK